MEGAFINSGIPEAETYDAAVEKLLKLAGREIPRNRLLLVGDGLPTDIKGAAQNGFDAYFITGVAFMPVSWAIWLFPKMWLKRSLRSQVGISISVLLAFATVCVGLERKRPEVA